MEYCTTHSRLGIPEPHSTQYSLHVCEYRCRVYLYMACTNMYMCIINLQPNTIDTQDLHVQYMEESADSRLEGTRGHEFCDEYKNLSISLFFLSRYLPGIVKPEDVGMLECL